MIHFLLLLRPISTSVENHSPSEQSSVQRRIQIRRLKKLFTKVGKTVEYERLGSKKVGISHFFMKAFFNQQ